MTIIPVRICYLCGKPILPEHEIDEDHVVQKTLLGKKQPKMPGFDYGGRLITHKECNNKFGGAASRTEVICKKALSLLNVLFDEKCYINKADSNLGLWAIDSRYLKNFSKKEIEFLG